MRFAYDIIGSRKKAVAIVEIPAGADEKEIAKEILRRHKNVRSVLKKISPRKGVFRLRECELIAGDKNTEVVHKEYGCLLKLDPRLVYFSSREGTERQRIVKKVKTKETILVMFSGIAPYAIAIAKARPKAKITCVEINPAAAQYAEYNIKLNKLKNIENFCSDVRDCRDLGKFDRIIMPLPEKAYEYLDIAFACARKGTAIHLYGISPTEELEKRIKEIAQIYKIKYKIIKIANVLPFGVRKWKIRLDIKIL